MSSKLIKTTLLSHIMVPANKVYQVYKKTDLVKECSRISKNNQNFLLFIEHGADFKQTNSLIIFIRKTYPTSFIILLTDETQKNLLVLMHELGVNNFIIKPASINTIIEKISLTINPHGKLNELIAKAKKNLCSNNFLSAMDAAEEILKIKEKSSIANLIKGDAFRGIGNDVEALKSYVRASKDAELFIEPLIKIANFFKEKKQYDLCIKYLEQLDNISPSNIERKIEIGEISLGRGEIEKANIFFDNAIRLATKEKITEIKDVKIQIAEAALRSGSPQIAEKYFREILDSKNSFSKTDIHIFNRLGISLRRQKKWEQAIQEYQKILQILPKHPIIFYNLGLAQMDGGLYEDAYDSFMTAIKLNKNTIFSNSTSIFNVGMACEKLERFDEALLYYQKIASNFPDFNIKEAILNT